MSHGEFGPINDSERVARVVTYPNHFRKDGGIKPGLFPPSHIRDGGLSLMRLNMMNEEELSKQAQAVAMSKPGEEPRGVRTCNASALRAIVDDEQGGRSLCVKDDPIKDDKCLPDNPAHAIAIGTRYQDDPEILRIRGELIEVFGELTAISDIYK